MGDCSKPKENCQDSKKQGIIYKIVNILNGKIYIGKTVQKLNERVKQHLRNKYISGIDGALKKYGLENFKVEVVEKCTIDILDEREKFWIAFYDCKSPNGYNLTDGGEGISNPSQETRKKLSKASKGRPLPESARENLSIVNSGEGNPFFGRHHTEETKNKISNSLKGRTLPKSTCEKMSKSRTGEKNHFYGKHHTGETKAELSKKLTGRQLPEEHKKNISAGLIAYWAKKKAEKALETKKE